MKKILKTQLLKIEEIFQKTFPTKIAVAVSGGCDSLALTLMLHEFCSANKIKLFALTVDHKMRKNSSNEAKELGKILAKKKIFHEILTIPAKKIPQKNIEANLREARYELLHDFCKKNKIEFLFLGHHLGDVAENFLIRLFRGSGLDGLSTMAKILPYEKIKLVRPFLDVEKDELKNFLRAKKVKWFEDETNKDEKFLRNKIRNFFESFEEKNLIEKRIKKTADEISEMRDFFDSIMLDCAKDCVDLRADMVFVIKAEKFAKLNEKIALKILALILMEVSGDIYKPRQENLKNLYDYLHKNDAKKPRDFYGCVVKKFDEKSIAITPKKDFKPAKNLRTILKEIF